MRQGSAKVHTLAPSTAELRASRAWARGAQKAGGGGGRGLKPKPPPHAGAAGGGGGEGDRQRPPTHRFSRAVENRIAMVMAAGEGDGGA